MRVIGRYLAMGLLSIVFCTSGHGQATAGSQISGTVTDQTGAAVRGAAIVATQLASGLTRSTLSGPNGSFSLPELLVGAYKLDVTAVGFSHFERTGIVLEVNTNPTINVSLKAGEVTTKISVNANAARVETHDNSLNTVINQEEIVDLPLDGRNVANLILLTGAGANGVASGNDLIGSKTYGSGAGDSPLILSIAGTQSNSVYYLLDGGDFNDAFTNVALPFPYPDALQEFSVQTTGMSARYGYHMGAVVSAVTRQGTNAFHATLFEYIRNYATNAAPTVLNYTGLPANFLKTRDSLKRNQFGGQLGGPILRDKLFFFGGTQITIQKSKSGVTSNTIPTPAVLNNGDWSALESAPCQKSFVQLKDPSKTGSPAFVGDQIPVSRYNPSALALLKNIPVPSDTTCGVYQFQIPSNQNESLSLGRVDYQLNPNNQMFVRYLFGGYHTPKLYGGNLLLTQVNGTDDRAQATVIGDNWTLTPNVFNAFRINYTHLYILRGDATDMPTPAAYGIQSAIQIPYFFTLSGPFNIGNGTGAPAYFADGSAQIADDIDWQRGRHQIALGADYIRNILNEETNTNSNGIFQFNSDTGSSLADFLLGDLNTFTQGSPTRIHFIQNYVGLYAQDTFKVNSRVTLNAGLRWEPSLPIYDKYGQGSRFVPSLWSQAGGSSSTEFTKAPPGELFTGDAGQPSGLVNKHWADFAPRVGFIADLTGQGKTTLRGSYGIYYDTPEIFYPDHYQDDQPLAGKSSYSYPITPLNPVGAFSNPYNGNADPYPISLPPPANVSFIQQAAEVFPPINLHPTYAQEWNLSVQHQFGKNWLATISYLGQGTRHIWLGVDINAAAPNISSAVYNLPINLRRPYNGYNAATGMTGIGPVGAGSGPANASNTSSYNLPYAAIVTTYDGGTSSYHGLLASIDHRFSNHFTLLSNYTYSHCLDDGEFLGELSGNSFQDPTNPAADRGTCGADHTLNSRNSLVISGPAVRHTLVGEVIGGWRTSSIVTYQSGDPLAISAGGDYSKTGTNRDRANRFSDQPLYPTTGKTSAMWFNPNAFDWIGNPTPGRQNNLRGTYGNSSVAVLRGPHSVGWAMAVQRSFPIYKEHRFELRVDVFNVLNHQGLGDPNTGSQSTTFGVIGGGGDGYRTMQGALKYQF